jgi:dienelactone hydrolase
VFSQGFDITTQEYATLITDWASAGFVVAAPTYPHTDPSPPTLLDESDIVNHPADLQAVITAVVAAGHQSGAALAGLINADEIGLVGQSDGGDVSLAVADNSCCRYPGVKAAAILSGAELSSFGGQYFTTPGPPILIVQGSTDTVNPPICSVQAYNAAPTPKYYLDLLGASHLDPYTEPGSYETVVARVTTAFFDAELAGRPKHIYSIWKKM